MSLLDDVSIVVTPNGYKAGELYAVIPVPSEGAEEITNGDFSNGSTDWSLGLGWNVASERLNIDTNDGDGSVTQSGALVVGKRYKMTLTSNVTGTIKFESGEGTDFLITDGDTSVVHDFIADKTQLKFRRYSAPTTGYLDNISVKEYTSADMDVTRATAATRVDENGLVNYAEIVGGEEVTNGDFATDTDWTLSSGWSIGGGKLSSSSTSTWGPYYAVGAATVGKAYKVKFSIVDYTSGTVAIRCGGTQSSGFSALGDYEVILVASVTSNAFAQFKSSSSFTGSIDNISVKEVTRDNVPRIDYTGGGCPHILAEPQRTNLITYSEDFSASAGWDATGAVVTPNQAISPDGTLNATLVELDTNADRLADVLSSTGGTYTFSFYVKAKEGESGNWVSRVVGDSSLFTTTFVDDSAWVKVSQEFTKTGSGNIIPYPAYRLNGTSTLFNAYIWGAQLEVGSYATSYIPTSGSTVTRNQDIFTRDGIGSLINSTEGVLFVEAATNYDSSQSRRITLSDGSTSNRVSLEFDDSVENKIKAFITLNGASEVLEYTASDLSIFNKIAIKWKANDFAIWFNGNEVVTETAEPRVPTGLTELVFDGGNGANFFYGEVKQLQVYDTALSPTQLAALTT